MDDKRPEENKKLKSNAKSFPIVAIGASAGGLAAITELLENLPADTGMAYVYIQHLDPTYKSALSEILQRVTKMDVRQIENLMPIETDHFYIIPPNADVSITDSVFELSERAARPFKHSPIDLFFLSLAEKQKGGSIGIILSGTASDGALGLKAIKMAGGLTFAQDESAQFRSMPMAAVAESAVDAVLSPKEMALELARLSRQKDLLQSVHIPDINEDPADEKGESVNDKDFATEVENLKDEDLATILKLLRNRTGVDFTQYKKTTIRRRIIRRMLLHKLDGLNEYIELLKKKPAETDLLYQDILINVTHFFRDAEATEYLKNVILPELLKSKSIQNPLRIWVPACSTGEEAYSLAMIILDVVEKDSIIPSIQIFATDLSETAIAKARVGIYTSGDVSTLSPQYLEKYFVKTDGHYRIIKRIRDICVFSPHNIFKDPPFSRIDIVSCCNLLIYLDVNLQKKALANFHYALNKTGYLVLGKSETVGASTNLFTQLDKKVKIFAKKNEVPPKAIFDFSSPVTEVEKPEPKPVRKYIVPKETTPEVSLEKIIDNTLLSKYTPPAVVVNHHLDIIQFRGSTGLFLEASPGRASLNLLKMARPGLELELRNALHKAIKTDEPVKTTDISININDKLYQIGFEVTPLDAQTTEKLLLIVFEEEKAASSAELKVSFSKDRRVKQLETELVTLREDMRSLVEEQEAANEELQSANEEIVSSNEELQSINEELETSKEELESSNEELMTINQELQMRNEQLAEANDYTQAVIETIREAAIVLDASLRVKSANKAFYKTYLAKEEETEGKYIYEFNNRQWDIPELKDFLEDIIPRNSQFSGFEVIHNFEGIGEKVLLLNGRQVIQKITQQKFILLAIEDITEHRHAERLLEEREAWLQKMADNVPAMIWVADTDKNFTFLNKTWIAFTGRKLSDETGMGWTQGIYKDDLDDVLSTYNKSFEEKKSFTLEYRMKRFDGEYRWIFNSGVPTFDANGEFTGYTGSCTEIHDKRINESLEKLVKERTRELQEANRGLENSNNELAQFAYVASHDLQEPLRKIITFSNRFKDNFNNLLPDNGKELIEKINSSSERMRNLINDLLNFSRIARFEKNFVSTDLNEVIKNVVSDFDLLIQEKNADLKFDKLPVIQAVPLLMDQLFHNLLGNALKFTAPDTKPVITITCRGLEENEVKKFPTLDSSLHYYEIAVKDNGIGFPQEFADQIFVIFQRLNGKDNYPGTGIGLALCRKIARSHHGEIHAESHENEGTVLYVILPEHQPAQTQTN
ncbi:CheR family methyltransferase [Segetibacter koreensis]|uniref:CheR family methyltransferase n=1 Tax=Segetibacter koreensis TaxID=398037 RepID=UPI0003714288|nr:CheR family methyltransferase [Segetibacter koreensis]